MIIHFWNTQVSSSLFDYYSWQMEQGRMSSGDEGLL
jgi:hypothetical protein